MTCEFNDVEDLVGFLTRGGTSVAPHSDHTFNKLEEDAMKTESARSDSSSKTSPPIIVKIEDAAHTAQAKVEATVETVLPPGSWRRVAAGVGAATIGGLWAAMWVGVGPAALAGTAGYLAYRSLHKGKKVEVTIEPSEPSIKH